MTSGLNYRKIMNETDKGDKFYQLTYREQRIIVFALGRAYRLCQTLATEGLGGYTKEDFRIVAEKFDQEIRDIESDEDENEDNKEEENAK